MVVIPPSNSMRRRMIGSSSSSSSSSSGGGGGGVSGKYSYLAIFPSFHFIASGGCGLASLK